MKRPLERLGVKIVGGLKEVSTSWAGTSLVLDLFRKLEMYRLANHVLTAKKSSKGLNQGQMVESFVLLSSLRGECINDMQHLRDDEGLMTNRPLQGSFIPSESNALAGLKEINRRYIRSYINNLKPGWEITLDVDTQLVETTKAGAKYCYDGYKAYQDMKVCWAETLLMLADEFRDGNVFPGKDIQRMVDEAFEMLPPVEWKMKVRSDSAAYDRDILDYWNGRHWGFAVSAAMRWSLTFGTWRDKLCWNDSEAKPVPLSRCTTSW